VKNSQVTIDHTLICNIPQIPISERLQAFCFFHVFFKTGSLPFEKNGLDQTHLFPNQNLELVQVQVQVQGFFYSAWKFS
jgi:hypothetical protein